MDALPPMPCIIAHLFGLQLNTCFATDTAQRSNDYLSHRRYTAWTLVRGGLHTRMTTWLATLHHCYRRAAFPAQHRSACA